MCANVKHNNGLKGMKVCRRGWEMIRVTESLKYVVQDETRGPV